MGVLWGRVTAIALVQVALTLMWITYNAYLGDMLAGWGFSEDFTAKLITAEIVLALVMEPVFGLLSDQQQRQLGSRTPLITLGIILSSALFVIFPIVAALNLPVTWILPGVAIAWALAMTTFRTPIYVLLKKCAPAAELPLATSVLTMTGGVTGIFRPTINAFILGLGAIPAFLVSSIVLLAASTFLKSYMPPPQPPMEEVDSSSSITSIPWDGFLKTAAMAITLTWGIRIFMGNFSGTFSEEVFGSNPNVMMALNLALALSAVPIAWLWRRWSRTPLLAIALGVLIVILGVLLVSPGFALVYILMGITWVAAFATVRNGTLPFIFMMLPDRWVGFGIGLYFGVVGIANNLFPRIFSAENIAQHSTAGLLALAIAAGLAVLPFFAKPADANG